MDTLQKSLIQGLQQLPAIMLKELLTEKLRESGVTPSARLVNKLADHILAGNTDAFLWKAKGKNKPITLNFSDADVEKIQHKFSQFLELQLPEIIQNVSAATAESVLKTLKSKWHEEYELQKMELAGFKERLEDHWGKPLALLRMLLTIARELGNEVYVKNNRRRTHSKHIPDILIRLHCRACQVTAEVITLLENGYADGAMARWRTLHEIGIVAAVIKHFGGDIAERYTAHEAIEAKRAMEDYERCHAQLGYQPLSARAKQKIEKQFNSVLKKYGDAFKGQYGWAAEHLKKRNPTLADLEVIAGRAEMRSHYQMASYNVHASPKGIFFRLGMIGPCLGLNSGASNAGLIEPGQNAAHTLTQITNLLYDSSKMNFDDIAGLMVMIKLRDEIPKSFAAADKKLRQLDAAYRKQMAK